MSDTASDLSQRFLLPTQDLRGETVRLERSLQDIYSGHVYSDAVRILLGQFAAAVVLISNNLKYQGRIILQGRSSSSVSLVMVECDHERHIRGVAQGDVLANPMDPLSLLQDGQLVLTIERDGGQRYQGIVSLQGPTLADALGDYFAQSEQLASHFWLGCDGRQATGLMLQQLPPEQRTDAEERAEAWREAVSLLNTLTLSETMAETTETLIWRLFHQHDITSFASQSVQFRCSCSRQRSLDALGLIGAEDVATLVDEQGHVEMRCEMCGNCYIFTPEELPALAEQRILH